ncbi:MAG: carbamoyltransferase C-terminal domain-containing protein [Planctomycetota bacterium]
MKLLGISPLDKDATVAAVEDGRLVFAAGEERFSRIKQHSGFPAQALAAALAHTGWRSRDVDAICYPFFEAAREEQFIAQALAADQAWQRGLRDDDLPRLLRAADERAAQHAAARTPRGPVHGLRDPEQRVAKNLAKRLAYRLLGVAPRLSAFAARRLTSAWAEQAVREHRRWEQELLAGLERAGFSQARQQSQPGSVPLRRGEHHAAHAAGAYLLSGFSRALVVTLDGYGSGLAGSISLGEAGRLTRLADLPFPHSLGSFYEHVTSSLGFRPDRHAGKIVGLAAYGDPAVLEEVLLSRVVRPLSPGEAERGFRLVQSLNVYFSRYLASRYAMIDVAAAWQHVLERLACEWVSAWLQRTGCDALVLSGGVAANVKLNQRLHALPGVRQTFIDPNMGDGGTGAGLALAVAAEAGAQVAPLRDVYLGPDITEPEARAALAAAGLPFTRPADLPGAVAQRLQAGQVVGRCDGRMEYGPRALGNRSILYPAGSPDVNQWLNQRLGRTEFMPFAPITRAHAAARNYSGLAGAERAAEFMTITSDCTPTMKAESPAAVHVDGTARPQLVHAATNPGCDAILAAYERLTGLPTLVNTSFNMHEEPIVCTAADAVRAFQLGRLDALVLGPYLADSSSSSATRRAISS